jgi:hypothetical protein
MRGLRPAGDAQAPKRRACLLFAFALVAAGAASCASDTPGPAELPIIGQSAAADPNIHDGSAIIVSSSAELVAALVPANAGRRIRVRAGNYDVSQPLVVPDHATLEGEGVMLLDESGLPTGFDAASRTTLTMAANTAGDVLTLGDGATARRIAIEDLAGRVGNAIGVLSRDAGDRLSAAIAEVEIINPNAHAIAPSGPTGCGVTVLSQNPNLGSDPPAHSGAVVTATITRSLIRTPATGTGCGVFAFNFAPLASVSVTVARSVVGGGIIANGGVSRPDAVHDSRTAIHSRGNLYRDDSPDPCVSRHLGWNVLGGSGTPVPLPIPETARNAVRLRSLHDRIEGFTTAILAVGGRRFFASPVAGPTTDNTVDLALIGTTISTPACSGALPVADFRLAGALVSNASLVPGDGNTVRAVIRGVTASGPRSNVYANVLGPMGPLSPELGTGNRLEIVGSSRAFARTNRAIDPAPGAEFFTGHQ